MEITATGDRETFCVCGYLAMSTRDAEATLESAAASDLVARHDDAYRPRLRLRTVL